ncbi:hypothetical protein [Acuticoccus kandeliae]|uniref:hypothetical protein n=1 Tax=Acuticoccus kandeliae TaxID=2073160 RepID=UPI000D3EE1D6|nr:hypothetical protein [Acuticoccus kandeliae]
MTKYYGTRCHAEGCRKDRAGFSRFCDRHRREVVLQGEVGQRRIRVPELSPYVQLVERRLAAGRHSPEIQDLVKSFHRRWCDLVSEAERYIDCVEKEIPTWDHPTIRRSQGAPLYREFELRSYQHILRMERVETDWTRFLVETAAMIIFREFEPHRFVTDRSFFVQLATRVGRMRRRVVFEDGPRAGQLVYMSRIAVKEKHFIGQQLSACFGPLGLHLANIELMGLEDEDDSRRILSEGLAALR